MNIRKLINIYFHSLVVFPPLRSFLLRLFALPFRLRSVHQFVSFFFLNQPDRLAFLGFAFVFGIRFFPTDFPSHVLSLSDGLLDCLGICCSVVVRFTRSHVSVAEHTALCAGGKVYAYSGKKLPLLYNKLYFIGFALF